ncbi:hypothetical protein M5K25_019067 [Dendrobium thyrsiflorum]|uniref:Uncharacterized protein n=1 Tax=Dendrobium thyrsiflorum TaxID=117978 RepID=A0ABD0UE36_DENTH
MEVRASLGGPADIRRQAVVRRKSGCHLVVRRKYGIRRWSDGSTASGGGPAELQRQAMVRRYSGQWSRSVEARAISDLSLTSLPMAWGPLFMKKGDSIYRFSRVAWLVNRWEINVYSILVHFYAFGIPPIWAILKYTANSKAIATPSRPPLPVGRHRRPPPSATTAGHRRPPPPATTSGHHRPPPSATANHHLRPPPTPPPATTASHHLRPSPLATAGNHLRPQPPATTSATADHHLRPPPPATASGNRRPPPPPPPATTFILHCNHFTSNQTKKNHPNMKELPYRASKDLMRTNLIQENLLRRMAENQWFTYNRRRRIDSDCSIRAIVARTVVLSSIRKGTAGFCDGKESRKSKIKERKGLMDVAEQRSRLLIGKRHTLSLSLSSPVLSLRPPVFLRGQNS